MSDVSISITAFGAGAMAAGRDVVGATPEQVQALIAVATAPLKELNAEQQGKIKRLAGELGVSQGMLYATLDSLSEFAGSIPLEALPRKVTELVAERRQLLTRQESRQPDPDAAFAELDHELATAMEAGDDTRTQSLLAQRVDLKLAAAALRVEAAERLHAGEHRDRQEAAKSKAELGSFALARLRYRDAAAHFRAAAGILPPDDANQEARLAFLDRAADALYRQGNEFGDNAALVEAIAVYHAVLDDQVREHAPIEWAKTQTGLGRALATLGALQGDTTRLEEAIVAHRAAIEERTRDGMPIEWAISNTELGHALFTLGQLQGDTTRLNEALAAHRAALKARPRDRMPLDWASTQIAIAIVLATIGERESGTWRLLAAVGGYRAALEEQTRERQPFEWAGTQNNLGSALATLGLRTNNTYLLGEAIAAYRAALEVQTQQRFPRGWAMTHYSLGALLSNLGNQEHGTERLEEAMATFRAALDVWTRKETPIDWARTKLNMAITLAHIADKTKRSRDQALREIDAALEVFRTAQATSDIDRAESVRRWIAGG